LIRCSLHSAVDCFQRNRNAYATGGVGRGGENQPILPFQAPRLIDRQGLKRPAEEIRRFMATFSRHPDLG
jgi:hypothetical protein